MDEKEYRRTLTSIDPNACVFEKAVFNALCECQHAHQYCVADRQGIHCTSVVSRGQCSSLLDTLRENARFIVHKTHVDGPLPHASEIKVQIGGLQAVQGALSGLDAESDTMIEDVSITVNEASARFAGFRFLPMKKIVQHIAHFSLRKPKK